MSTAIKRSLLILLAVVLIAGVIYAYWSFSSFKQRLLLAASTETSKFLGQRCDIGDISFSISGLSISDIRIYDPEGFPTESDRENSTGSFGQLLAIKRLEIKPYLLRILRGKLDFKRIYLKSPNLTLRRAADGSMNISEKLREFLLKEEVRAFSIGEFRIGDGNFAFEGKQSVRIKDLVFSIKGLSPVKKEASFAGSFNYDEATVRIEGTTFLPVERTLHARVSSDGIKLHVLGELFKKLEIDLEKTKTRFDAEIFISPERIDAKGKAELNSPSPLPFKFFKPSRRIAGLKLNFDISYSIKDDAIKIEDSTITAGEIINASIEGSVREVRGKAFYNFNLTSHDIILSDLKILPDYKTSGRVSALNISFKGNLSEKLIEISGSADFRDVSIEGRDISADRINAAIELGLKGLGGKSSGILKVSAYNLNLHDKNNQKIHVGQLSATVNSDFLKAPIDGRVEFKINDFSSKKLSLKKLSGESGFSYIDNKATFSNLSVSSEKFDLKASDLSIAFPLKDRQTAIALKKGAAALVEEGVKIKDMDLSGSFKIEDSLGRKDGDATHGKFEFSVRSLTVKGTEIENIRGSVNVLLKDNDVTFQSAGQIGSIAAAISGSITSRRLSSKGGSAEGGDSTSPTLKASESVEADKPERHIRLSVTVPEAGLSRIQESLWHFLPEAVQYAKLAGSAGLKADIEISDRVKALSGEIFLKRVVFNAENNEYIIGPVDGIIPLIAGDEELSLERASDGPFEKKVETAIKHYRGFTKGKVGTTRSRDDGEIIIGAVKYGPTILDDVKVWLKAGLNTLNIKRISANMFGGQIYGSAKIDVRKGFSYTGDFVLSDISLTTICDELKPIRGYISGRVDGLMKFKGEGTKFKGLMGIMELRARKSEKEPMKISREFLQKVGGSAVKKVRLTDRYYDRGVMTCYMQDGYLVFKELEISHKNFLGFTDLSVNVMPVHNRVALDDLLWKIKTVIERASDAGTPRIE
ncbi:MAG: hypothetical protein HZC12_00090 [Nitrospirae bacterium]|nr:hypothetical protein [Nitrospirota bacterium]